MIKKYVFSWPHVIPIVIFVFLFFVNSYVEAQRLEKNFSSQNQEDLYNDFLSAIFLNDKNFRLPYLPQPLLSSDKFIERLFTDCDWLKAYWLGKEKTFNPNGLTKRASPIVISYGFPNHKEIVQLDRNSTAMISWPYNTDDSQVEQKIKSAIGVAMANMNELTGLDVSYTTPDESSFVKSNLHIIYVDQLNDWDTIYKKNNSKFSIDDRNPKYSFRPVAEGLITNKYNFTPDLNNQVDGYNIVDADNNIVSSYCYVWKHHNDAIFTSLIHECLLRSLGFPNSIDNPSSLMGAWNSPFSDPVHKDEIDHRMRAFANLKPNEISDLVNANNLSATPSWISDSDREMISLLYQTGLSAGDSYENVRDKVFQSGK